MQVLEIRPTIKWDKGKALEFLLESLGEFILWFINVTIFCLNGPNIIKSMWDLIVPQGTPIVPTSFLSTLAMIELMKMLLRYPKLVVNRIDDIKNW